MLATLHSTPTLDFPTIHVNARRRHVLKHCDVCGIVVEFQHVQLAHPASGRLICCCHNCAGHLTSGGSQKYRRVPDHVELLPDFTMTDLQWDELQLPIHIAFAYRSTPDQAYVLVYPGAAGPVKCVLRPEEWDALATSNPILQHFLPDVEALLLNRVGKTRRYFRAPIDECFKLTEFVRDNWNGVTGGIDLWRKVEWCFESWKRRAASSAA